MDPVKEPMCSVCGATQAVAALVGRQGAGWVCAVSGPCIDRSTKRAWLPVRRLPEDAPSLMDPADFDLQPLAKKLLTELRAEDPDFGKPCDIPLDHRVTLAEVALERWTEVSRSGGTLESKLLVVDPLHPTGRCTCGGECRCEWCLSHCAHCGSTVWPYDEGEAFDYEALGYPETDAMELFDIEHAAFLVGFVSRGIKHSSRPVTATEKDIAGATDIVDSGSTDSYK